MTVHVPVPNPAPNGPPDRDPRHDPQVGDVLLRRGCARWTVIFRHGAAVVAESSAGASLGWGIPSWSLEPWTAVVHVAPNPSGVEDGHAV